MGDNCKRFRTFGDMSAEPDPSWPLCRRGAQGLGKKPSQRWRPGQHVLHVEAYDQKCGSCTGQHRSKDVSKKTNDVTPRTGGHAPDKQTLAAHCFLALLQATSLGPTRAAPPCDSTSSRCLWGNLAATLLPASFTTLTTSTRVERNGRQQRWHGVVGAERSGSSRQTSVEQLQLERQSPHAPHETTKIPRLVRIFGVFSERFTPYCPSRGGAMWHLLLRRLLQY